MNKRYSQAVVLFTLTAAVLLALLVPSAAAQGKDCDFFSCPFGCCDEYDQCHTEWSSEYCGYYGEDCVACEYPTPYCFFEVFYAQCTACNFLTCPFGCCDDQGGCHSDNDPNYCGYYGEDCVACEWPNPYCFNEGVYAQCTPCDVFTCPDGCCGDDGYCHTDDNPQYCGYLGLECDTCTGDTPNCILGICSGCDPILCATGCCDPDNVCHTENTADYCGIAGTDCFSCSGDTPNCYNGWCVGCSDDFPCAGGCCDLRTSLCHPGDSNELCGAVGALCDNCEIDDLFCLNGQCLACDAGTCGSGCCDSNGACRPGTENNFCGTGGGACVNCAQSGQFCIDFACGYPADDDTTDDDTVDDDNDTATCGLDNCLAGCCQNGQCWPGDMDDKCGIHAAACVDCQADGKICYNYACVTPVDDDTTPGDDDVSPDDDDTTPLDDDTAADDTAGDDTASDDDDATDDDIVDDDNDNLAGDGDDDSGGNACGC